MRDTRFHILRGNATERLADRLATLLRDEPPAPFEELHILVQSSGMATWLQHRLADQLGICSQVAFPFPQSFLESIVPHLTSRPVRPRAWTREQIFWSVLAELPARLWLAPYADVNRYLASDPTGTRLFQLARRIARMFSGYLVFRPHEVRAWDSFDKDEWQADLFAAVKRRIASPTLPDLLPEFDRWSQSEAPLDPRLPKRLFVFGIASVPPFFLELLRLVSRRIPVYWFALTPSRQYWADIRSQREVMRATWRTSHLPFDELHFATDNALLGTWGRLGAEFQALLEAADTHYQDLGNDEFVEWTPDTALRRIQADFVDLARHTPETRVPLSPADRSIEVHVCHGPMRQVEVLRDVILDALQRDPTLQPRDIVVLTPDLPSFAPLVDAVFRVDRSDPRHVPFSIADRSSRTQNAVAEALFRMLSLASERVTATQVLDLLTNTAVQRRLALASTDLETLTTWVRDSGIRWGIDARHKERAGRTADASHSWRHGLLRMLLGFAYPAGDEHLLGDVLPYPHIEGESARELGRVAALCERIFDTLDHFEQPRPIVEWGEALLGVLTWLVDVDPDDPRDELLVRETMLGIMEDARSVDASVPVAIEVVRSLLEEHLSERRSDDGFLAGGVTFCALLPMRAIPFRVVCMLGMDHASFPRASERLPFDLIGEPRRAGDRNTAMEDRYLFLECLLSTRDRFIVAYTGRDHQENRPIPPSIVVDDLLDFVDECMVSPDGRSAREILCREHAAQPFSPQYFDARSRIFTFQKEYLAGAQAVLGLAAERTRWIDAPLPAPAPEPLVDLAQLVRFFDDPVNAFFRAATGVRLGDPEEPDSDQPPLELDALERYGIGDRLLQYGLREGSIRGAFEVISGQGLLPPSTMGELEYHRAAATVERLLRVNEAATRGGQRSAVLVDFALDAIGARVRGLVRPIFGTRLVEVRFGRVKPGHLLRAWIQFLALQVHDPDRDWSVELAGKSMSDRAELGRYTFEREPNAAQLLADLVALYRRGQSEPLLFFPVTSFEYAEARHEGKAHGPATSDAAKKWSGYNFRGEGDLYSNRRWLDDRLPFEEPFRLGDLPSTPDLAFSALATRIFGPMLNRKVTL